MSFSRLNEGKTRCDDDLCNERDGGRCSCQGPELAQQSVEEDEKEEEEGKEETKPEKEKPEIENKNGAGAIRMEGWLVKMVLVKLALLSEN